MIKKILAIIFAIILVSSNLLADLGEKTGGSYVVYTDANGRPQYMWTEYYENGTVTHFSDGRPSITWQYGQNDLPCCYGIVASPNPKTSKTPLNIQLDIDPNSTLTAMDVHSISYELISPTGVLITTVTPPNPMEIVTVSDQYITMPGVYTIVGRMMYWDANNQLVPDVSTTTFIKH